jgi:purine-binding chemotaxis protein CheW
MHAAAHNHRTEELLAFRIGAQEFCVDLASVREIRGWTAATPMPHAPSFVRGVVNLRGAVLPILDLAERSGLPPAEPSERHVIIVSRIADRIVGLLVDAVSEILAAAEGAVQPPPDVASERTRLLVRGLLAIGDRMATLISLDHLLLAVELAAE